MSKKYRFIGLGETFGTAALLTTPLLAANVFANHGTAMPEVIVEEFPPQKMEHTIPGAEIQHADTAEALKSIPGAAVNRNGGITGIAQYRGFYGDRVAVAIDSAQLVTGGPNAMDAPLSYIPATLLKELRVERGVSSVSKAQESLGGLIEASSEQGEFGKSSDWQWNNRVHSNYSSHNDANNTSLLSVIANDTHRFGLSTSFDTANDSEFDGGELNNTDYERRRHDFSYGYQSGDSQINLKLSKNNTGDAGTAALPMDITAIDSDLAAVNASTKVNGVTLSWSSDYSHVFHAMDNFRQRPVPGMGKRETFASGQKISHKLMASIPVDGGEVRLGADHSESRHDADVYNPDMPMFLVENFNGASRDISGAFVEWQQQSGQWFWELGLRINRVKMDSDEVSASVMPAMQMMANTLANNFNNDDLAKTYNNRDLVLKTAYRVNDQLTLNANIASKQRAPSYQERYLWMPMQATGGLADGRTYIGNRDLDSETANEINLGFDYQNDSMYLNFHSFYRKVSDYIQGTPEGSGMANLRFSNIDAKLCGGELGYGMTLTDHISLDGHLSYVRGKRDDGESDNLYRIAPMNNTLALNYREADWSLSLVNQIFDQQNKVSQFNGEEETSGYSLWHIKATYNLNQKLQLRAAIDNLTDKRYQDHLAGYNRAMGNDDIAVGERLYGTGRSLNLGATYHF